MQRVLRNRDLESFHKLCSHVDEKLKPDDCSPLIEDDVQQVYKLLAIWYCDRDKTRISRIDHKLSKSKSGPVKCLYAMGCALRDQDSANFSASAIKAIKTHLRSKPPKLNRDFLENWLPIHIMSVLLMGDRCNLIDASENELLSAFLVSLK